MCAQSHALGTRIKFQLEILSINVISGIVYFREFILESSRNISETTSRPIIQSSALARKHDELANKMTEHFSKKCA